jgi:exoribonuclease R
MNNRSQTDLSNTQPPQENAASYELFSKLVLTPPRKPHTPSIVSDIERSLPVGLELHRSYHYVLPLGQGKKLTIIVLKLHCPEEMQEKLDEWRSNTAPQFDSVTILIRQIKGDQNIKNNLRNTFQETSILTDEHSSSIDSLIDSLCGSPPEPPDLLNKRFIERENLTSIPFVAIDRVGTKDIEDLIHGERKQGGELVWRTAFIDATDYIQPKDPIDTYAMRVASTIYGKYRTVPTLGTELSHDLLSFLPGEERPAWIIEARLTPTEPQEPKTHRFHPSYSLRYKVRRATVINKQSIDPSELSVSGEDPLIRRSFSALADIARILHHRRASRASLLRIDSEGAVSQILAEIMIESKRLLSDFLGEKKQLPMIYRVHQKPSQETTEHFHSRLDELAIPNKSGDFMNPQEFAGILRSLETRRDEKSQSLLNHLIDTFLLRTQFSSHNFGHFGLRLESYAEFKPRDASGLTNQYQLDTAFTRTSRLDQESIQKRAEQLNEKRWRRDEKTYKLRFYEMLRERLSNVGTMFVGTVMHNTPSKTYLEMEGFSKWGIINNQSSRDGLDVGAPVAATLIGFDINSMRFIFNLDHSESLTSSSSTESGSDEFEDLEFKTAISARYLYHPTVS